MNGPFPATRPAQDRTSQRRATISVRARMTLLLALTVAAVAISFYFVQRSLSAQLDLLVRSQVADTARVLRRVLDLRASSASVHADDYTRWDDFVAFARKPDPQWGQLYLTENIQTFAIDVAWVLDDQFRLIFTANPKSDSPVEALPMGASDLTAALQRSPIQHF